MTQTPYDDLFDPKYQHTLNHKYPRSVQGDVRALRFPKRRVSVCWWMVSDLGSSNTKTWEPLVFFENVNHGRCFVYAHIFNTYMMWLTDRCGAYSRFMSTHGSSSPRTTLTGLIFDSTRSWLEWDVRDVHSAFPLALGFLVEPRGTIPKFACDWIVNSLPLEDYRPTYTYFPLGSEEHTRLRDKTRIPHPHPQHTCSERIIPEISTSEIFTTYQEILHDSWVLDSYEAHAPLAVNPYTIEILAAIHTYLTLREKELYS